MVLAATPSTSWWPAVESTPQVAQMVTSCLVTTTKPSHATRVAILVSFMAPLHHQLPEVPVWREVLQVQQVSA